MYGGYINLHDAKRWSISYSYHYFYLVDFQNAGIQICIGVCKTP